jgi:hypothetical protein
VFDEIKDTDRNGEVVLHNNAAPSGDTRRWKETPFAFDVLLATWHALRARPDIAFRDTEAWPHESSLALGQQFLVIHDDPAVSLVQTWPTDDRDPQAVAAWVSRQRLDVAAVLTGTDASGHKPLASRCDRFIALTERAASQPSR